MNTSKLQPSGSGLRVAEFMAEKWRQKDKKKNDFSAPIFLPLSPASLLQGHEEEEFLAEKWRQKDKKTIHFSAPIFLPFPPALLLQGHELNSVSSQIDPMEGAQWTVAKKRMKLLLIVLGACGEGRQPKCRVLVDKMGTLVPQRQAVAPQLHHPRHFLLAAKEVGQRFHVKAKFEKAAPIRQQIQKSGEYKVMAERWGQKNQKEIHFSAPIFLPLRLLLL